MTQEIEAIILDTETTGFEEPVKIVEAAYLAVDGSFDDGQEFYSRFNPGREIGLGAKATHHILEQDLVDCPPSDSFKLPPKIKLLIGHNIDYDWKAIGSPEKNEIDQVIRRVDTLAMARKYWPELDSHSQSAMMYHFYGSAARERLKGAHNALQDVRNCFAVLVAICAKFSIESFEQLWRLSETARIPDRMSFGKHGPEGGQKGMLISEMRSVDHGYCQWLLKQDWLDPYLRKALTM